jgi:hypothetical protein
MRLHEKEALIYLADAGYPLQRAQYYCHKRWLNKHKLERLHFIASIGFENQHCDRIDTCETIEQLMWQDYRQCEDPYKRVMILKEIKELQPYISSYYEATKDVISTSNGRQDNSSISKERITTTAEQREAVF